MVLHHAVHCRKEEVPCLRCLGEGGLNPPAREAKPLYCAREAIWKMMWWLTVEARCHFFGSGKERNKLASECNEELMNNTMRLNTSITIKKTEASKQRRQPSCMTSEHFTNCILKQDQLPCESTGTSSGNSKDMEICTVWACHMPRQPLQNHLSGHLGG